MRSDLTNWIQTLTAVAVLVGLGLVIYELRQAKELAMADLMIQQYAFGNDVDNTMLGENPMGSRARDCMGESITPKDALILHEYFWATFDKLASRRATLRTADPDTDWSEYARTMLTKIFSTKRGRIWWEIGRESGNFQPDMLMIGDELLSELDPPWCADMVRRYVGSDN